jgi:hypothetical protein
VLPEQDLTISVLTNAIDGLAHPWLDGVVHILKRFSGTRRSLARDAGLDRPLVDDLERQRPRALRRQGAGPARQSDALFEAPDLGRFLDAWRDRR